MCCVLRDWHVFRLVPGSAVDIALGGAYLVDNPWFPDRKVSAPFLQAHVDLDAGYEALVDLPMELESRLHPRREHEEFGLRRTTVST